MILNIDDDVAEVKHVYYFGDGMGGNEVERKSIWSVILKHWL